LGVFVTNRQDPCWDTVSVLERTESQKADAVTYLKVNYRALASYAGGLERLLC
jgi:hypothetical protein